METVITRDTDIIREYLAALAERERSLSPFARIAATVKLAQLRRELDEVQLETTDEDAAALRREVNERISRTFLRRFVSHTWGARLSIFLLLVVGQEIALALWLLATMLFVKFAAVPKWWNPVFPREETVLLQVFAFLFLAATPMISLQAVFGGRYFRSIRKTLPATILIFAMAGLGTYLIFRKQVNPIVRSSMGEMTKQLGVGKVENYDNWVKESWLLRDQKFRRDYESYLRNGPGRWITSRFDSTNDAAWAGSLSYMQEYVETGQDIDGFREWLQYYLDRNRIYSTDRTEQEVMALTGEINRGYLGVWQLEPFLKERDERVYKAYLGTINHRMRTAGLIEMGVLTLVFLVGYLLTSARSAKTKPVRKQLVRNVTIPQSLGEAENIEEIPPAPVEREKQNFSFPERGDIKTNPFFDTPFEVLSKVHRSFIRVAVFTCILTFIFWAVVYAIWMASSNGNPRSQIEFMQSNLLVGGPADEDDFNRAELISGNVIDPTRVELSSATMNDLSREARLKGISFEEALQLRLSDLGSRLDENEYKSDKEIAGQSASITKLRSDLDFLRSLSSQFQQTTSQLPTQLADLNTRATAAEARAGEALGQASGTRQIAETIEGQLNQKLQQVESRAARVAEQIGKVEEQASLLATRTESLEKELDRRARQIEARTEELGERTAALKEREERLTRLQRAAFNAILVDIRSDVDDLDRRTQPNASRALSAAEARGVAEAINARINALAGELREMNTDQSKQMLAQIEELSKRVEQISSRVK
jgi:hypothetical protein